MLTTYFKLRATVAAYRAGPAGAYLDQFTTVSFRQGCVKRDIGAKIRIIGAGRDGLCAWRTWREWSPCRLRRRNRTCD
jgi:hypothetical protein